MESVKVLKKSEMQMTNNQEQTLRIAGVVKESIVIMRLPTTLREAMTAA